MPAAVFAFIAAVKRLSSPPGRRRGVAAAVHRCSVGPRREATRRRGTLVASVRAGRQGRGRPGWQGAVARRGGAGTGRDPCHPIRGACWGRPPGEAPTALACLPALRSAAPSPRGCPGPHRPTARPWLPMAPPCFGVMGQPGPGRLRLAPLAPPLGALHRAARADGQVERW